MWIKWKCPKCEHAASVVDGQQVNCKCGAVCSSDGEFKRWGVQAAPLSISQKGLNYAIAWVNWTTAGMPTRTDDEVQALRAICAECEFFNGELCTHQKCGCNVKAGGLFGDKLKWATEHCPIGKW